MSIHVPRKSCQSRDFQHGKYVFKRYSRKQILAKISEFTDLGHFAILHNYAVLYE